MKIYLATWLFDKSLGESLTKKRARQRLLSYFFITADRTTKEELVQYIEQGFVNSKRKKK